MKSWDRMWNAIGDYFEAKAEDLFDARAEEWARGYEEGFMAGVTALAEGVHEMLDEQGYPPVPPPPPDVSVKTVLGYGDRR